MRNPSLPALLLTIMLGFTSLIATAARVRESFNDDWLFMKGQHASAETANYNDSFWRKVRLPHDWAIEGPFSIQYNARAGGLPFHGVAWYRKHFSVPASYAGKVVTVEFDGAMNNSEVWVNGHFLGKRPFGYIGFEYDMGPYLNYGEDATNIISVRLSPEDLSSRWYPGAGLYRNTWLNVKDAVHVAYQGTYLTHTIDAAGDAHLELRVELAGATATVDLRTDIFDAADRKVASVTSQDVRVSGGLTTAYQNLILPQPERWDLNTPYLYQAVTTVILDRREIDSYPTTFGVRSIAYDKDAGFTLNGRQVKFKGVCMHHDLGPLGAAVNYRATERQMEIMKSMGVNAIRTSHNPPSPELLEVCDKLGLLVQVEAFDCWAMAKVPNGYNKDFEAWHERDLRDTIRRDRNHPSVIMWSIGNEILEQGNKRTGAKLARRLARICKEEDPTRPTTAGFNYYPASIDNGLAAEIDLVGFNYKPTKYTETLANHPDWIVYGAETSSCTSSRGTYHLPIEKYPKHESLEVTSYDLIGPPWAYPPDMEFHFQAQEPRSLGEFIWTGFDYLGEPTPYGGKDNSTNGYWNFDWPSRSSYFGAVDLCGFPKDRYYLYQSQWTEEPMVHVLPHWNWEGHEGRTIPVYGYTNCDEAELFLNGKSQGRRVKGVDKTRLIVDFVVYEPKTFDSPYRLSWDVPYEPGELKIVGYRDGKAVAEKVITTAGKPAQLVLIPDRRELANDGYDLSFITVRVEDSAGNFCPEADNRVWFKVEGAGKIAAVGNGFPATEDSFQANHRAAFNGLCMVIVQAKPGETGNIKVSASAKGLRGDSIDLTSVSE